MGKIIKNILKYYGYEISKPLLRNNHILRRHLLLEKYAINKVLDVGANIGQYSNKIRKAGYKGDIISFEPLHKEFERLKKKVIKDNKWIAYNYALGNSDETCTINVAGNSESSSILEMLPIHIKHWTNSKYIRQEEVTIKKLDSVFDEIYKKNDNVFLKIDAQGYEYNVLEGAKKILGFIQGIQIEMSLEPLYAEERSMCEMINYLSKKGYKLMSIEPGAVDGNNGQMFQVDGVFFKTF